MKGIIAMLMTMVILAGGVMALPTFPMIISGEVDNEGYLGGIEVTLTNIRTDEEMVTQTDNGGHFQFNPKRMSLGIEMGEQFKLSVEGEEVLIDDFNYETFAPYEVEFDLTGKVCPECKSCPEDTTLYAECDSCCPADNTPYADCDNCCDECPEAETITETIIVCYDGTEVNNVSECPEPGPETDLFWVAIAGILAAAGGAGVMFKFGNDKMFTGIRTGVKMYRGRNGEMKIKHKHPGTRGYHSPNRSHYEGEKHPKGKIDVSGHYKKINDEWRYV